MSSFISGNFSPHINLNNYLKCKIYIILLFFFLEIILDLEISLYTLCLTILPYFLSLHFCRFSWFPLDGLQMSLGLLSTLSILWFNTYIFPWFYFQIFTSFFFIRVLFPHNALFLSYDFLNYFWTLKPFQIPPLLRVPGYVSSVCCVCWLSFSFTAGSQVLCL